MKQKTSFIHPVPSPIIAWTVATIGGIHLQSIHNYIPLTVIYALLIIILLPKKTWFTISIAIFMLALGASMYHYKNTHYERFTNQTQGKTCDIIATVQELTALEHPYLKQRVILKIHEIKELDHWISLNANIVITVAKRMKISVDDLIVLNNITFPPTKKYTPSLRDGYYTQLFPKKVSYTVLEHPFFSLKRWISVLRTAIIKRIQKRISPRTFSLFSTIFLGNKTHGKRFLSSIRASFKQWGVLHYLARSGLHLTIVVIIWHYIISLFLLSPLAKSIILLLLVFIYALLSWQTVSFVRALLMFLLYTISTWIGMKITTVDLVALACLIVVITNPYQIFCLDFQLSFSLTFALAWLHHVHVQIAKSNH